MLVRSLSILRLLIALAALYMSIPYLYGQSVHTYIPERAYQYFDIISEELNNHLPDFYPEYRHYFPGLIEHESCISLTHSRCWSPTSRLKSAREEGAGLPQITRAYKADGTLRFDTLANLRRQHSKELKELTWDNIYQRPDLQIRAMILLSRSNFQALAIPGIEPIEHIAFSNAAYNGGLGGVRNERRACGLAANCDPNKWFDNVERYCLKSKAILYGNRNACDINRYHAENVIKVRMPKYEPYFTTVNIEPVEEVIEIIPIPGRKPELSITAPIDPVPVTEQSIISNDIDRHCHCGFIDKTTLDI